MAESRFVRTYGSVAEDGNPEKRTSLPSPLFCFCLGIESEPAPATHFFKFVCFLAPPLPLLSHTPNTGKFPHCFSTPTLCICHQKLSIHKGCKVLAARATQYLPVNGRCVTSLLKKIIKQPTTNKHQGCQDSTVGRALGLHIASLGSIPNTPYHSYKPQQE